MDCIPWGHKESDLTERLSLSLSNQCEVIPHWSLICCSLIATVRTGHGPTDWFQIGKGVHQGCILSPHLFNLYAEYIMRYFGLEEA